MAIVALVALCLALVLPLVRQSYPPCLSTAGTARWLLTKPGTASCKDCHGRITIAANLGAGFSPVAESNPRCAFGTLQSTSSCTACHENLSRVAGTAPDSRIRSKQEALDGVIE
jgi:hypothetical protein